MRVLIEADGKWYEREWLTEFVFNICGACDACGCGEELRAFCATNDNGCIFREIPSPLQQDSAQLLQDSAQCLDDCMIG